MKSTSILEISFLNNNSNTCAREPARFGLTLLQNGCYTLSGFFEHNLQHYVLTDWLKINGAPEQLNLSVQKFNEFLTTYKLEEFGSDELNTCSSTAKENMSSSLIVSAQQERLDNDMGNNITQDFRKKDFKLLSEIKNYPETPNNESLFIDPSQTDTPCKDINRDLNTYMFKKKDFTLSSLEKIENKSDTNRHSRKESLSVSQIDTIQVKDSSENYNKHHNEYDVINYKCGKTYEGHVVGGKANGFGNCYWDDGDKYIGEWKNDQKHGKGCYQWSDGEIYFGNWKDNVFEGQGEMWNLDRDKYCGLWKNGLREGYGEYLWSDGCIFKGYWRDGFEHGDGFYTDINGKEIPQTWRKGKKII